MAEMLDIVRVALAYGPNGAHILGTSLIHGPDPRIGAPEPQGDHGAWLSVHAPDGREAFRRRLADPATASEWLDPESALGRLESSEPRTLVVELPWPGAGSSVRVRSRSSEGDAAEEAVEDILLTLPPDPQDALESTTPLLVHPGWGEANPNALTLLFLPDGFAAGELEAFRVTVERCIEAFARTEPFRSLRHHLRFARVDIPSKESGIVGESPRRTAFKGRFQKGSLDRVILIDQGLALKALNAHARTSAVALVVANTTKYGGSGGVATVFSCDPDWSPEIALHELGHSVFGLADEYEADGQSATVEPVEPNVCAHCDRARLKWAALVPDTVKLPTLAAGEPVPTTPPAGVGAFEGGKYKARGVYRPAFECKMRSPGQPFCAVCEGEMRKVLARHAPS